MKTRKYIKKRENNATVEHIFNAPILKTLVAIKSKRLVTAIAVSGIISGLFIIHGIANSQMKSIDISEQSLLQMVNSPAIAATTQKSVITIPTGIVKANPFVPYRDIVKKNRAKANDVPTFNLVEPPEVINENSDAARVMDTIVSGILYDKYSPSAILNIEGSDYLVKKGDVVNNYKVVNIMQDSVTVQLGANVYKAGIGEILTEGAINHNDVSNLKNKFGGERQ